MPTYEYETIPAKEGGAVKRYEIRQSMSEEPLKKHPETGERIRRVYSSFAGGGSPSASTPCGDSCECAHNTGHHHHGGGCGCGCCS